MGPEIGNSSGESSAFAQDPFGFNSISQVDQPPESPPAGEITPVAPIDQGDTANASVPSSEPQPVPQPTPKPLEQPREVAQAETTQAETTEPETAQPKIEQLQEKPAPKNGEVNDFTPEEIADVKKYIETLRDGANSDLRMADALERFCRAAENQRSSVHPASRSSETSATSTSPITYENSSTNDKTAGQNAADAASATPETTPPPIRDMSAAIAEALAETTENPLPGPQPIATPPANLAGPTAEAV